jgi:hypothetical protein
MGFFSSLFKNDSDWSISELAALVKSLEVLAGIDGDYDKAEESYIIGKLNELKQGFKGNEFERFQKKLNTLTNPLDSIAILKGMSNNKKKIVADSLLELSIIDGNCDEDELGFQGILLAAIAWKSDRKI